MCRDQTRADHAAVAFIERVGLRACIVTFNTTQLDAAAGPRIVAPERDLDAELRSTIWSPAELARWPAVRLLVDRVRDVQPGFCLTAADGRAVVEICRRLDALPLALELAAPWLKVLSAEGLCDRLARDVLLSAAGSRDLPERQQTINATVAWSYQLLGADQQRVFRRLGALPGSFPIEAVAPRAFRPRR
jgi:predicted ATPase